ncbi:MAG TPA: DUF2270 domain-containing protein [Herpetosiphonaceae bacterium]
MQRRNTSSPLTPAVMVHFYRGVMDLATTWRARIDNTTNWAVVTAGSIASFLLSDSSHPHLMALLGMFLVFAFLAIEARRFRFYDLWSGWLRLMETDYYAPLLQANVIETEEQWHPMLRCDLDNPHFKISLAEAMGRRLRHNYFAIFMFLLLVWFVKLLPPSEPVSGQCVTFLQCAAIGPIPGSLVLMVVGIFYALLLALMIFTPKLIGTGTELIDRRIIFRRMVAPNAQLVGFKRHSNLPHIVGSIAHPPEED